MDVSYCSDKATEEKVSKYHRHKSPEAPSKISNVVCWPCFSFFVNTFVTLLKIVCKIILLSNKRNLKCFVG